jgi:DNA repair protein RecO
VQLAAQFLSEVAERVLPEREVNERAFRLVLAVLRALRNSGEVNRPLLYFDYWILRLGGFLPDFEICAACGKPLGENDGFYGPGSEGLVGQECRAGSASQRVSAETLAMVRAACHVPLEKWLAQEKAPPGCREARRFFESVIETHTEKKLITREMMEEEV